MMGAGSPDPFRGPDPFSEHETAYRSLKATPSTLCGQARRQSSGPARAVRAASTRPGRHQGRRRRRGSRRQRLHSPVDLDHPYIPRNGGLEPSDSNPHFHQQMVYAVISHLLRTFDRALGRQMRFHAVGTGAVSRLTVRPHAMRLRERILRSDHGRIVVRSVQRGREQRREVYSRSARLHLSFARGRGTPDRSPASRWTPALVHSQHERRQHGVPPRLR